MLNLFQPLPRIVVKLFFPESCCRGFHRFVTADPRQRHSGENKRTTLPQMLRAAKLLRKMQKLFDFDFFFVNFTYELTLMRGGF